MLWHIYTFPLVVPILPLNISMLHSLPPQIFSGMQVALYLPGRCMCVVRSATFTGSPMDTPDTTIKIQTLGSFSISAHGKLIEPAWPDEASRVFFCSLLSPLDLFYSWDRICRTLWGEPATRINRRRLEKTVIRPLDIDLTGQLGITILIAGAEGIRIDHQRVYVDALEFHGTVVEGLKLLTFGEDAAAMEMFTTAHSLYKGSFLPGVTGKIVEHTRTDLDSLYSTIVRDAHPQTPRTCCYGHGKPVFQEYRIL